MKRPFVRFLMLASVALVGTIIYSFELSMPDRFEAIEMASARAVELFNAECGHTDDISVTTKVIARVESFFHVESEVVTPEMVAYNKRAFSVHSFVYPSIDLGLMKIENIDVVGVGVSCWE